jgi:hypothetical protein
MKRIIAVVLITLLVAPPVDARQKQSEPIDWQKLKAGTEIVLTVVNGQPATERVLFVDEAILVTRRTAPPKLPGRVEKFLVGVGSRWPAIFNDGLTCTSDRLRVSQDGVFDGEKRLADLTEVVRYTPRSEVLTISEPPHSHVSWEKAAVVAIVVFAAILVARLILGGITWGG